MQNLQYIIQADNVVPSLDGALKKGFSAWRTYNFSLFKNPKCTLVSLYVILKPNTLTSSS